MLRPDGYYFLLCDAKPDGAWTRGASLSRAELADLFRPETGWEPSFVVGTTFERRYSRNPAYLAGARRL